MPHEIYKNAPITEAALDIRVRPSSGLNAEMLDSVRDPLYPELFRKPLKIGLQVEGNAQTLASSASISSSLLGFAFRSTDQKNIYQVRTDGFTLNRLAPYQEWDIFAAEARRLWTIYRDTARPEQIELIGLNYQNQISVPLGARIDDYFRTYIEVPEELPQTLDVFSMAYQLSIPDSHGLIHIGMGYGPPKSENTVTVVLHIQAFQQLLPNPVSEDELWSSFAMLREAKTNAFEACITDRVREMIR